MIVWFHAYDRVNYSRHFTYCWATQKKLHDTHPEIYQEFKQDQAILEEGTTWN